MLQNTHHIMHRMGLTPLRGFAPYLPKSQKLREYHESPGIEMEILSPLGFGKSSARRGPFRCHAPASVHLSTQTSRSA